MINPAGTGAVSRGGFGVTTPELEVLRGQDPPARGAGTTCRLQKSPRDRRRGEPFFRGKPGIQVRRRGVKPNLTHDKRPVRRLLVKMG